MIRGLIAIPILGLTLAPVSLARYSSPFWGFSFRYPQRYELKEGSLAKTSWGTPAGPVPMDFVAPGGVRVVTVEPPEGTYSGTDVAAVFFTVSANRYLTKSECEEFAVGRPEPTLDKEISGARFYASSVAEVGGGRGWAGMYYHAFFANSCYEVGYGVGTVAWEAVKIVDEKAIDTRLEQIVDSVSLREPEGTARPQNMPVIRSFDVAPLRAGPAASSYRISWDVQDASPGQVWLVAPDCAPDISLHRLTRSGQTGENIPCGAIVPVDSTKGTLAMKVANWTGLGFVLPFRLFVAGHKSVSRTQKISPPVLPVIFSVATGGNRYSVSFTYSQLSHSYLSLCSQSVADYRGILPVERKYVQLVAGQRVEIAGAGFLPTNTLNIGRRRLTVLSTRGVNLTFQLPGSFPAGTYSMSVVSKYGRSNVVSVRVVQSSIR